MNKKIILFVLCKWAPKGEKKTCFYSHVIRILSHINTLTNNIHKLIITNTYTIIYRLFKIG